MIIQVRLKKLRSLLDNYITSDRNPRTGYISDLDWKHYFLDELEAEIKKLELTKEEEICL